MVYIKVIYFVLREKIIIDKKRAFVALKGAEDYNNPPKITWNDTANSTGHTSSSATVYIKSDYFVAINIIFEVFFHFFRAN